MKDCVGDAESSIHEEEKKESHSPVAKLVIEQDVVGAPARGVENGDLDTEWPIELISLRGRQFATEEQLEQELETLGCADICGVHLDDQGFAFFAMPSSFHNEATTVIVEDFRKWKQSKLLWMNNWGVASATVNVDLHPPHTTPHKKRCPDIAFWGYSRCFTNSNKKLKVKLLDQDTGKRMDPHVVIKFSWKNDEIYEVGVINDLMNRTGVGIGNEAINVGYLVKVRFTFGVPSSIDVYKVPRGATRDDAINRANGGEHWTYTPGQADVVIRITPVDLGFTAFWASVSSDFEISIAKLWVDLFE
jgi:hypothetical protein